MAPKTRRARRPVWVRVGLWGLETRVAALVFFWGCVILALAFAGGGVGLAVAGADAAVWVSLLVIGGTLLLPVLWYGLAIRWVDRHDHWA